MNIILTMYITLMPVILAGVANMKLLKSNWLLGWTARIDGGKTWRDGRPVFGENKTWRGALGMVVCSIIAMIIWGFLCRSFPYLQNHNQFYQNNDNTIVFNGFVGFWLGVAYIVFELPNSFWKRRQDIPAGQASEVAHPLKYMWLDQMDSLFGCALVLAYFQPISIWLYLAYVILGAATHLIINTVLVKRGWKKSI